MNDIRNERWRDGLRQFLETEASFGLTEVPRPAAPGPAEASRPASGRQEKAERLEALYQEYKDCQLCPLKETRKHVVFGSGDPDAELLFVGEAPGFEEDQQGLPFVGAAGQLLTKIIQAMKLSRDRVYIANCLKCRPPQNRNPLPTEIATCSPILRKQIEIIRPKVICALGKFAAQTLLKSEEPISRLRGRFTVGGDGIKYIATFHPAYLLRNPDDKKLVWNDMKSIMNELGISP